MESSLETRIRSIGSDVLTPIVQRATGCAGQLSSWTCDQVHITSGGLGASVIYRFSGSIQADTEKLPWSLILKVLSQSLIKGIHLNDLTYLRRENEFYQSDLGQSFPAGFRAARCYSQSNQQNEAGEQEDWLWLEDLTALAIASWDLVHYAQAARALGKFNSIFLVDRHGPKPAWLNSNIVRDYLDIAAPMFQRLFEQRDQPLVRRMYPPDVVDSLAEMWRRREEHLATLDRLPQALCHGDAVPTNLFLTANAYGEPETVAIDWGGVGVASIGLDLAKIFLGLFLRDEAYARTLDRVIFGSYLDGLRAAGWHGDPRWVRLGYTAAMLMNRATYILRVLPALTEEPVRYPFGRYFSGKGLGLDEVIDKLAWIHAYLGELFAESLILRKQLF